LADNQLHTSGKGVPLAKWSLSKVARGVVHKLYVSFFEIDSSLKSKELISASKGKHRGLVTLPLILLYPALLCLNFTAY